MLATVSFFPSLGGCGGPASSNADVDGGAATDPACPGVPSGASGSPRTIPQVVDLVNALVGAGASPLTLPCLVSRFDRPLAIEGVDSEFSAQPADGVRSPRIFAFFGNDDLIVSVVPAGDASDRLELAEYPTPLQSIKAEIAFPVVAPLPLALPYDRIRNADGTGTVCGGCHRYEVPAPQVTVTRAFLSGVFQPLDSEIVSIPFMEDQARSCDATAEPFRCALLRAVVQKGDVTAGAFPADAPTIYE